MLLYDLENLLGEVQYGEIPDLQIDLDYTVRPFAEVEDEYLTLFAKYSGTVAPKTVYPVSYTHLDVYKRQVQHRYHGHVRRLFQDF